MPSIFRDILEGKLEAVLDKVEGRLSISAYNHDTLGDNRKLNIRHQEVEYGSAPRAA